MAEKRSFVLDDKLGSVELIRHSGSDLDVVNAARVSFGDFQEEMTDRDVKLIRYLLRHNHTSPFEHNQLSYRIKCPFFVARQWMRHRIGVSYNEISYRYVKAPLEFFVPSEFRAQSRDNKQASVEKKFANAKELKRAYQRAIDTAVEVYEELLAQGVARELARAVLPSCTYTEFIFTCNLVSLMHFVKLRDHPGAQEEIRRYARAMKDLAQPFFFHSFSMWEETGRLAF